jgi:protein-tyrosine phosphatase
MAELMLGAALEREGLDGLVTVDSAGTTGYEAGRPIDPRAARRLSATQLISDRHVARQWQHAWFRERDLILALDIDHHAWLSESGPGSGVAEQDPHAAQF